MAVLLLALVGAFAWLVGTSSGGRWLLQTALPYTAPYLPDNMRLNVNGIETNTLADVHIAHLELADADGIWLEIEGLRLLWHPFDLLQRQVRMEELSASRLTFSRPPLPLLDEAEPSLQEQISNALQSLEQLPQTLAQAALPPLQIERLSIVELLLPGGSDAKPMRYALNGKINLQRSPFSAEVRLESIEGLAYAASLKVEGTPSDLRLALDWQEPQNGLLGSQLMLATPAPLHAKASATLRDGRYTLESSLDAAEHPLLRVSFDGSSLQAEIPVPAQFAPLAEFTSPLTLSGTLAADEQGPSLAVTVQTAAYQPPEGPILQDITLNSQLVLRDEDKPFAFHADAQAALVQGDASPLPLSMTVEAIGSPEEWDITSLQLAAAHSRITAQGAIQLQDGSADMKGEALLALPLEADTAPAQSLNATFEAQASSLWEKPEVSAQAEINALQAELPEELHKLLPLPLRLSLKTQLPDAQVILESTTLNGRMDYLGAAVEPKDTRAKAEFRFAAPDMPALRLEGVHRVDESGNVIVSTETKQKITFSGDYSVDAESMRLSDISLQAGEAIRLGGALNINTAKMLAEGRLTGNIRSLTPLKKLGLPLPAIQADKGTLNVNLTAPENTQKVAIDFNGTRFTIEESLSAASLRLKADVSLPEAKPPALSAQLDMAALSLPVTADSARVEAKGTFDGLDIRAEATNVAEQYGIKAESKVTLKEATTLDLQSLAITWPRENRLRLASPGKVVIQGDNITLAPLEMRLNDKTLISAKADLNAASVSGALKVENLPFSVLPVESIQQLRGRLGIDAALSGAPDNPRFTFAITSKGLQKNYPRMGDKHHSRPLVAEISGGLAERKFTARVDVDAEGGESTVNGNVTLPATLSLMPGAYNFELGEKLEGALKANVALGSFLPLVLPDGVYGSGQLIADFTVGGALQAPDIRGNIALDSGRLEVLSTGTVLEDITLKATANGPRVTITEGSATDGGEGRVTLSGFVELTPDTPLDIKTVFQKAAVMQHANIHTTISGDMALKGDANDSLLSGQFNIDRARLTIAGDEGKASAPELPVIEVASLDAPIVQEQEEDEEKQKRKGDFSQNMALGLAIRAPNQIFVEGFGLDSELKASVDVKGTAANPKLEGKMETIRGRWQFVGRNFTITRGQATLQPDNLADPLLDIECQAPAGEATAIATIQGRASKPNISFSSIPALPQDEILARVMFGKNLNSISPIQAIELAQMVAALKGKGGGIGIFGKVKDAIGVDDFTVGGGDGEDDPVTVGVGKHLSDNVYLGVEGGAGENSGKVSVEVDLTPRISVETEARQNAETAVRFNYKYDY